jgi:DNA (cytosine-5)-methyltransferase 1
MESELTPRETLKVPDRFEALRDAGSGALQSIIVPVQHTLTTIDSRFADLSAAGRGGLMILRGDSGSGKSTFLDTGSN